MPKAPSQRHQCTAQLASHCTAYAWGASRGLGRWSRPAQASRRHVHHPDRANGMASLHTPRSTRHWTAPWAACCRAHDLTVGPSLPDPSAARSTASSLTGGCGRRGVGRPSRQRRHGGPSPSDAPHRLTATPVRKMCDREMSGINSSIIQKRREVRAQ